MASAVNNEDSGDEFIPKRRSVKTTIASDDEDGDSDTPPINTEDIRLCLSDDGEYEETQEANDPPSSHTGTSQRSISPNIESLNSTDATEEVLMQSSASTNLSTNHEAEKPKRVPFHSLIDSDSEPEETSQLPAKGDNHSDDSQDTALAPKGKSKQSKRSTIWDSDSDKDEPAKNTKKLTMEDILSEGSQDAKPTKMSQPKITKRHSIWDSDEDEPAKSEESQDAKPKKKSQSKNTKRHSIWDSDSDEEEPVKTKKKSSSMKTSLVDSDSEDMDNPEEISAPAGGSKEKNAKSKSAPVKEKKANPKDAMLAIRAESQRMTRESPLALPYHRPKQHSLSDFLNRRRLAPSSIKAPVEELVKFQKESEKEIQEFYQSESEQSDDDRDDPDWKEDDDKEDGGKDAEMMAAAEAENAIKEDEGTENRSGDSEVGREDQEAEQRPSEDMEKGHKNSGDNEANLKTGGDGEAEPTTGGDLVIEKQIGEETQLETGGDEEAEKKISEHVEMDTEEIALDEEDCDHGKIEGEEEGAATKEQGLVLLDENSRLASEKDDPNQETTKSSEESQEFSNLGRKDDDTLEEETQKNNEEKSLESDESKQTESCPIDSQDIRLKYSEDLTESVESKYRLQTSSDSEDDDYEMLDSPKQTNEVFIPAKPREKLKLRGNPNDVIDLDDDFSCSKVKSEDVEALKSRFMRHSLAAKPKSSPISLSLKVVDRASDGSIQGITDETLTWNTEKAPVDNTPPGLKMKMLKKELQRQIIEQREKEFLEKEAVGEGVEKEGYEDGDDILDDKEDEDILDDKEDEDNAEVEDDGDHEDELDGDDEDDEDEDEDDLDDDEEELGVSRKKKKKSMFIDEEASVDDDFDEDSVDLADKNEEEDDSKSPKKNAFSRTDTTVDMFASQMSDDDDLIPGYQPRRSTSSLSRPASSAASRSATPLGPSATQSSRLSETTQGSPNSSFQRMLRFDRDLNSEDASDGSKHSGEEKNGGIMELAQSAEVPETEADLMALCSGKFVTQPFLPESQAANPDEFADSQDSQDLQLKWIEDSPTDEAKSQKKVGTTRLVIESSDDEEEEETTKKKTKRLSFSDDESNSVGVDEFINDEEEEEEEDLPAPEDVMYDSDENEIPVKAAAFLENEAELSEDEYQGSGDEDEAGDNDEMEEELGDRDEFDQDKVREELGRIHMRNLLDDDRRDVRLMQEMLLEDGEDHEDGKGRQRQFRWKNADLASMMTSQKAGSDEEGQEDDEEDDGGWRQNRYEREMFLANSLKEKAEKGELIEIEEQQEESELMVLGKTVLKRQSSTRIEVKETVTKPQPQVPIPDSPMKSLFSRSHARGSFLTRTSDVLMKVAENATGKNGIVKTKTKDSRNFVFAAISPPKSKDVIEDIENDPRANAKRKAKRSLIAQPEKKTCLSQPTQYSGLFDYL